MWIWGVGSFEEWWFRCCKEIVQGSGFFVPKTTGKCKVMMEAVGKWDLALYQDYPFGNKRTFLKAEAFSGLGSKEACSFLLLPCTSSHPGAEVSKWKRMYEVHSEVHWNLQHFSRKLEKGGCIWLGHQDGLVWNSWVALRKWICFSFKRYICTTNPELGDVVITVVIRWHHHLFY